jgi:hypothetical protein
MKREELFAKAMKNDFRPHRLAKDLRGNLYEFISLPYTDPSVSEPIIKVRVPGDPTTVCAMRCFDLSPEGRDCYCDVGGEFYCRKEKAWCFGGPADRELPGL